MDKLIWYAVVALLLWCWVMIYAGAGPFQGLMIIVSICAIAGTKCRGNAREGR